MRGIHAVAKPVEPVCNILCSYCFHLEKQALFRAGEPYRMPDKVLGAFIAKYVASQPKPVVEDYGIPAPDKFTGKIDKVTIDLKQMTQAVVTEENRRREDAVHKKAMSD